MVDIGTVAVRRFAPDAIANVRPAPVKWDTHEALTVSTVAKGPTAIIVAGKSYNQAMISVETAAVKYRLDGYDPTASTGHNLEIGDILILNGRYEVENFRVIRRDAADSTLRITYGRVRAE